MSSEAMAWAWDQDPLPVGEKLTLLSLADGASSIGISVERRSATAAHVGVDVRTIWRHVQRLAARGLLWRHEVRTASGAQTVSWTVLSVPDAPRSPEELLAALSDDWPSSSNTPLTPGDRGVGNGSTKPLTDQPPRAPTRGSAGDGTTTSLPSRTARETNRTLHFSLEEDPDEEIASDGQTFLSQRRKVGTQIVTAQEMRTAVICMSEFNRQAGTDQSLGPNLVPIVGRVREHPSWDSAKYVRLIQSAFRLRWWEKNGRRRPGQPTPKVIFGSTDCFVNVANDAADEAAGRTEQIEERRGKYDRSVVRD